MDMVRKLGKTKPLPPNLHALPATGIGNNRHISCAAAPPSGDRAAQNRKWFSGEQQEDFNAVDRHRSRLH